MWEIINLVVVEAGNETQGWGLEDTKQGLILGGPFSKKGGPRKGVQKVFEIIGTDCSMRLKLHTEHEVKMTKCFNVNEIKLLCYIYMYSVLSSNIRMNNFVSSRPQVLWKQSLCDS